MNIEQYDENGVLVEWTIEDRHELNECHERDFWAEDDEEETEEYTL